MDEKIKRKKQLEMKNQKRRKKLIEPPKKKKTLKKVVKKQNNSENSVESKPKKYVSKKRIKRRNRFLVISSLILILVATFTTLSFTVFFPIKIIKIINSEKYSIDEIASAIGVVKGDNLLLASEKRAFKSVQEKYPYIKAIEFDKKLPFTLNVNVVEYETFAQVKFGNSYVRVSKDGRVLQLAQKFQKGVPVVTGVTVKEKNIGEIISIKSSDGDEEIFSKIDEIISAFSESEIGGVTLINFTDMQDIRVTYNNKIVMLLGSSSNLDKKLAHAKATLDARGDSKDTGTLNLSRIPSAKNEASFIPRDLEADEIAGK